MPKPQWEEVSHMSPSLKSYWSSYERLRVHNGVLFRLFEMSGTQAVRWQIILPKVYIRLVLNVLHDSKVGGHMGMGKTLSKVRLKYHWYGMSSDIRAYIRSCNICARNKPSKLRKRAPLQTYLVGAPMERIAIDVLGPFPESAKGNRKILVVGDYFTRWMEAYPIPNEEARTIATVLLNNFFIKFGLPLECHSDLGRNFVSNVFKEVCDLLGVHKTYTTPRHPQSDGLVERYNLSIVNYIRAYMDPRKHQSDWDENVCLATFAYRSCVHPATGETPNLMMLGKEVYLPLDVCFHPDTMPESVDTPSTDYVTELRDNLQNVHEHAREQLQSAMRRQKRHYDRFAAKHGFEVGEFVWVRDETRRKGRCPKLQLAYDGPYLIIDKISDVVFRIQRTPRSKSKVIHFEKLKKYQGEKLTSWLDKVHQTPVDERQQIGKPEVITVPQSPDVQTKISEQEKDSEPDIQVESKIESDDIGPDISPDEDNCVGDIVDSTEHLADINVDDQGNSDDHSKAKTESMPSEEKQINRYPKRERKPTKYFGFASTIKNAFTEIVGNRQTPVSVVYDV